MTTEDLNALAAFLRESAPDNPETTLPTGHRGGGFLLSWRGRLGQVIASVAVSPATGLACVTMKELTSRNHRRVEATLDLLQKIAAFAVDAEAFMRELKTSELVGRDRQRA